MSGKKSRNKGRTGEQEIVNVLKSHDVPAKRISMMETGGVDKGDVDVAGIWDCEVKYGAMVPKWIYDEALGKNPKMAFVRRISTKDRGYEWVVMMPLEFFLSNFI